MNEEENVIDEVVNPVDGFAVEIEKTEEEVAEEVTADEVVADEVEVLEETESEA